MATENKIEVKRPENFGVWVLVINKKGEVILGKRKNSFMAGWWGAPGGRVNLDEPLEKAAQRELEEETGIQHNQFEFVGTVRDLQGTYNFIHFCFAAVNCEQVPKNTEPEKCEGWEWVPLDQIPENTLRSLTCAIEMYRDKGTPRFRDLI